MSRTFGPAPDIEGKQPDPHFGWVRKSRVSSVATSLAEPDGARASERRIALRAVRTPPLEEALKRAVIAFARSQQPSVTTRERILSSVLAQLERHPTRKAKR
jgi:hypothetical protein